MYLLRLVRFAALFVGGASILAALFIIPLFSAYTFLRPLRVVASVSPAESGTPYEDVRFEGAGIEMAAWFIPGESQDAVIVAHGIHASRADLLELAIAMHEFGYTVLVPDMRAHGASGGDFTTYGFRESADILAAVRYVKSRGADRVALIGFSLGAASVLMAAPLSDDVRVVVADSSFSVLGDQMDVTGQSLGLLSMLLPIIKQYGSWIAGIDIAAVAPIASVALLGDRHLLLIHGEDDKTIPPATSRMLYEVAAGPKELWIVPGATHVASMMVLGDEYTERVGEFLKRGFGESPD